MKKLVIASAFALATIGFVPAPAAHAQDTVTLQPAEYNAYQSANTQSDPKARAAALEGFLKQYPNTAVKRQVLDDLLGLYQNPLDPERLLSASNRLIEVDPGNLKAYFFSVWVNKAQGLKTDPPDPKAIVAAAETARKGLAAVRPAGVSDSDWKKLTDAAYPAFHSAIGLDAALHDDFKTAISEYNTELKLLPPDASRSGTGLADTARLALAYAKVNSKDDPETLNAIWFYARAWNYATGDDKAKLESDLKYWYVKRHDGLDGLDDVKKLAAATVFPTVGFMVAPGPTLAEKLRKFAQTDPDQLSLADKETILAHAFQEDADRVWARLKDQTTPVPGTVIAADASTIKVTITEQGKTAKLMKTTSYLVKLTTPLACGAAKPTGPGVKEQEDFILDKGFKYDTDQLAKIFSENPGRIRKIVLDPAVSTIKVAVTDDAKQAKTPDFIVNLKSPVACNALPPTGAEIGMQASLQLIGTYDSYAKVNPADPSDGTVQIVLRDGFVQTGKKKPTVRPAAAAAHKVNRT